MTFVADTKTFRQTPAAPTSIAGALREAVVCGEIKAGTPLRQDRIAAEFGVSHIPVREALKELVVEGLAVSGAAVQVLPAVVLQALPLYVVRPTHKT